MKMERKQKTIFQLDTPYTEVQWSVKADMKDNI
jgi:hypothetical protein